MGEKGITISDQGGQTKVNIFEDVDLLSEEERAAMADDDTDDSGAGAVDEAAADLEAQAAEDAKKAEDEAAAKKGQEDLDAQEKAEKIREADEEIAKEKSAAGQKSEEQIAADKAAKEALEAGGKKDADTGTTVVVPQNQPPVMMDVMSPEEVEGIKTKLTESDEKFKNGEIDYQAYFDEKLGLERQIWQNEVAMQISTDGVENQWQWEQNTFLADEKNDWINANEVVYSAFAATVNRIMATDEGSVLSGPMLLAQAREEVASSFSPTKEQDGQAAADKKAGEDALKGAKAAQAKKQIPETLSRIPAAEAEEGEVGEFSFLDKLEGDAYERAVEALSPAQLTRYENAV